MRIIVFFDLPIQTSEDKRNYRKFRKFLIEKGFLMMQESVYCKLALNGTVVKAVEKSVRDNKPPSGIVQMLVITEKQYGRMEYVVGEKKSLIVDTDDRLLIL